MRFSLALGHQAWTRGDPGARVQQTIDEARTAERHGFDSVWISEDPDGWDAFVVLSTLARETASIRLGTGVTNPFLRHPNLIGASVATLDRVSGGRAFLGLGRGQPEWYQRALGVPARDPLALVAETVRLLKEWEAPPYVATEPGPIAVNHWQRTIGPIGSPPVYLAATGPKMQVIAGRVADGVRFNELASDDFLAESVARVRASAEAAGRDPAALRFFYSPGITITDEPHPDLDRHKTTIALIHALPGMDRQLAGDGLDTARIMGDVRRAMKTNETLARGGAFADLRRDGDLDAARKAIPDDFVMRVAAVGTLDAVRTKLARLSGFGITDVFYDIRRSPGGVNELGSILDALGQASARRET